ncbi:GIY-YIG nuclease family protein [Salinibacter ruber]|uniref:GIY-YIG nuclease family protein n=1 Tax=Salinibacter ruber TaxID=146919 RepID=UPI002168CAFF|nr:GIY-YIG nuclease family protein [Salinibacter ruber]MCS4038555.1 Uri superfamily endonuclease [Salinibacter ruber]
MTDAPGTYALLLQNEERQEIEVGALGAMTVRPGVYVYVGSAFGPGGLRARVGRHARGDGALHWHVDYLRAATALEAVWYTHDPERRECTWAAVLRALPGASVPVDGFGASDCTCPAHLVRFEAAPSVSPFRTRLRGECPDHEMISRFEP